MREVNSVPWWVGLSIIACVVGGLTLSNPASADPELGAVALHQALLDMGTDLRLMCVAAHPDDEDGATLAMYRKKWGYKTFAVIATRGEGGQNEIGPELYNELGVIRTHEMMRASEITGAELHFLDLPEFGYSKSADETYGVWGKDEPLRRMVRKIRELRPDVLISNHGPNGGHGHHQVVGQTLLAAFDAAADPKMFPEQIAEGLDAWQIARFYQRPFGGSSRRDGDNVVNTTAEIDPARGYTYAEIAGQALWEHESQGMGFFVERFLNRRSSTTYYLQEEAPGGVIGAGATPAPGGGLFAGLNDRASASAREISLGGLDPLEAKAAAVGELKRNKSASGRSRANRLATKAMEMQLYTRLGDKELVPGQDLSLSVTLADYGEADGTSATIAIEAAHWTPIEAPDPVEVTLGKGPVTEAGFTITIPDGMAPTIPHPDKLFEPHFLDPQLVVVARVTTGDTTVELRKPVLFDVAPAVSIEFSGGPYLAGHGGDGTVTFELMLTNHSPGARDVEIELSDESWFSTEQRRFSVNFGQEADQKVIPITATIKRGLKPGDRSVTARIVGTNTQAVGVTRLVDVVVPENIRVGVIQSYDDTFMTTLERFGVPHKALQVDDFTPENLDTFTTIILDIRAYLVRPEVVANNQALLDYVKRGGTLIVNYHKTFEWKTDFPPYSITVSRNRVTVEDAPIRILEPKHPLFNVPNKIVDADWDGWKQERGLYFPNKWDDAYTPLIDVSDPGENPPPGSCLIADYGEGTYFYTALGWYRQLRELHPGTLRIFANMLAL